VRLRRGRIPAEGSVMPVGCAGEVIARYSERDPARMYRIGHRAGDGGAT
jgi:hypothetical protein